MSSHVDAAIQFAIEEALRAREEARRSNQRAEDPAAIRAGVITGSDGSGSYTVALAAASGAAGTEVLEGVRAWAGGTFEVGARVFIVWAGSRPLPHILTGAGGGDGVYIVVGELGFAS